MVFCAGRRCNMRLQASAKAVTAKAAAAVLSPADPYILLQPATAFTAATVIILPVYLVLAVAPRSKLVSPFMFAHQIMQYPEHFWPFVLSSVLLSCTHHRPCLGVLHA